MEKTKENLNKIIYQIKTNKWMHYIILIVIGVILSLGLSKIQIRETHDGFLHFLRILGTVDSLEIGEIIPLINQNYCRGFGYAMNLFYPPIVTYIPLLINLFTKSYMLSLKVYGGLCIIASGITMYHFTYQTTKNRCISLLVGFFYIIAPYKLANVYKRYAIGEFTALVLLPLVFLGLYNLFNQDGKKHYYIAIGAIGLMLSHTVSTLYTAIFCIIYILYNIDKLKNKEILKKCIINAIFILCISSLFWAPLLEATSTSQYVIMENEFIKTNGSYAAKNTISFYELFVNTEDNNKLTFLLGIPTILAIIFIPFSFKKIDKKYKDFYITFLLFALISLVMVSKFFPWEKMPDILCKLQYPWRMMGFFSFFISFICGINIYNLIKVITKKEIIKIFIILIFIVFSTVYTIPIMQKYYEEDPNSDKKYEEFIYSNKKISHMSINRDYLPIKAIYLQDTYLKEREDRCYVLKGNIAIAEENKENLTDNIKFQNASANTIIEFPYFFYVGYEVELETLEGVKKIECFESENGFLAYKIEEDIEEGSIKVQYKGTKITYISYMISVISLIIFTIYIIKQNKKGELDDRNKEVIK